MSHAPTRDLDICPLEGKRVIAPPREVQEVENALSAYDRFGSWYPHVEGTLLEAHRVLMADLMDEPATTVAAAWGSWPTRA